MNEEIVKEGDIGEKSKGKIKENGKRRILRIVPLKSRATSHQH